MHAACLQPAGGDAAGVVEDRVVEIEKNGRGRWLKTTSLHFCTGQRRPPLESPIDDGRRTASRRVTRAPEQLEALGTLPERARVGNGARGLQPRRQCLGVLPARSCAVARLPLERRRNRRHLRSPSVDLLRHRVVERAGSDSQGAAVRPHGQRGQSRRGREGVLLLPGQHADALVHEVSVQVPAACISLLATPRREPSSHASGSGIRAGGHGRVCGRSLLRRLRRIREGLLATTS